MSAPSTRGQRGGSSTRGGRATPFTPGRGRGSIRGSSKPVSAPRGRGRGGSNANVPGSNNEGLLQRLRTGSVKRGADNAPNTSGRGRGAATTPSPFTPASRGRGRGPANLSQTFAAPKFSHSAPESRSSSPAPSNHRDYMNTAFAKFTSLKQNREEERAKAIRDGFLADPEKKTSLDKAITPVGTCTDMCPEFERVERIVQNMVDKAEKVHNEDTGKDIPAEDRMVKRFRRSAAGYDEQLPSDIRTPATLKRTLDYLLDNVVGGGERLATIHKFVWDRTRGIRNDFSIQQVTNVQDVKVAVECYERIARFHILSLHQLSNPDNLLEGENFDAHQEREQLNNTLLSLLYYYDDNRRRMDFPNEGEFRAYCVIFEFQSQHPDMEDRMQAWPRSLLNDKRVQTALKLYAAAGNSLFDQGPLRPTEPFVIAQSNTGSFWNVLSSQAVPYTMACVAEIYFGHVRFAALDALWRSCKSAPAAQQAKSKDWSLTEVTSFLGFDDEEDTKAFCEAFDLYFATDVENGDEYLDATSNSAHVLDQSSIPNQQSFSHSFVEKKRHRRTLTAVINGATVAEAIRQGWIVPPNDEEEAAEEDAGEDDQSMFFPETRPNPPSANSSTFGSSLNPQASPFAPKFGDSTASVKPMEKSTFGQPSSGFSQSGFGKFGSSGASDSAVSSTSAFGQPTPMTTQQTQAPSFGVDASSASSNFGVGTPAHQGQQPFSFGGFVSPPKELSFKPQANEPASPAAANSGGAFAGFNFGKSAFTPPAASTVPPIFGPRPAVSGPIEEARPTTTAPSTTSFPSSNLAPFSSPALQQPGSLDFSNTTQPKFSPTALAPTPPAQPFAFQSPAGQAQKTSTAPKLPATLTPPAASSEAISAQHPPFAFPPIEHPFPSKPSSNLDDTQKPLETFKFPSNPSIPPATTSSTEKVEAKPKQPQAKTPVESRVAPPPVATEPVRRSTTPPHSPRRPPSKPVFTKADRDRLAENVARVALTQSKGLLASYIEFTVQDLVTTALNQHVLEVRDAAIASVRERILARKFGYLWRSRAWTSSLNRRAKHRRHLFAETIRAEQERQKRSEEELEEILRATRETKRLQKEVQEAAQTQTAETATRKTDDIGKIAGQKRKGFEGQHPKSSMMPPNGTPFVSGHKRSKTMGTSPEASTTVRYPGSPAPNLRVSTARTPHISIFSRTSLLGRSTSTSDLRRSTSAQRVDTTRTDYFRLKALGVDPETPIIPDTKETLAIRRLREAEEKQASIDRTKRRVRDSAPYEGAPKPGSTAANSSPAGRSVQVPTSDGTQPSIQKPPSAEDDFLKQIREAREAMAEQTEWFKSQRATLGEEIKQEEESRQTPSSHDTGSPVSKNGLAQANGYEYLPGELKSGMSLSRTERRIRATGAHGLATKPLRSSSDYVPVAMSKKSARTYAGGSNWSSPGRKRSHDDMEPASNTPELVGHIHSLPVTKRSRAESNQQAVAGIRHERPRPIGEKPDKNPYHMLQFEEEGSEGDDDAEDTDELFDEGEYPGRYRPQHPQNGASAYDEGEEELEEDDEEEDEEGEEGEEEEYEDEDEDGDEELDDEGRKYEYPPYRQGHFHQDDDDDDDEDEEDDEGPTPPTNPQISRAASSAPGGSLDDALVLSDSD